ncbi:MAG: hypothetical protein ACR2JC_19695 [Chloroflexota bacterium]
MDQHERVVIRDSAPSTDGQTRRISRAQMLAWAGAGAAVTAFPGITDAQSILGRMDFPFYPQVPGTYTPEAIQDILNVLVTMERFAVAINASNLTAPKQPGINPVQLSSQQSAIVGNLARVDFLESLGAQSLTDTFTVGAIGTFGPLSLKRAELVVTIFVGTFMTAAREFAELGQPLLVKWAFQAGAVLAEERALARALQAVQNVPDAIPLDNKAFETDLFVYVRDAYTLMTKMGLFGGLPAHLPYPSRDEVVALAGPAGAQVLQKRPNNATVSIATPGDVTSERM